MSYRERSAAFDARILGVIARWHETGTGTSDAEFDDLAVQLFEYHRQYNHPYARYCGSLGIGVSAVRSWRDIPPVPASAFKDAVIATFAPSHAALAFETSGTTSGRSGRHYFETPALYDAALVAGFDHFMLPDAARLRYLNLVPNPAERPQSSLGYMMERVASQRGAGETGWYVRGAAIALERFVADLREVQRSGMPACIAATAFALSHVLEWMSERAAAITLPRGSRIMETGGFKGRERVVDRDVLYAAAAQALGVPRHAIVAEYGMTELTSQYYDDSLLRSDDGGADARRKLAPPWLRTRVVGPDGATLPDGTVGALVHVDLANRSSCIAVATEDLGVQFDDGLMLIGRERGAPLRGCSLDAETLSLT